jgi:hypothetical protein
VVLELRKGILRIWGKMRDEELMGNGRGMMKSGDSRDIVRTIHNMKETASRKNHLKLEQSGG